MDFHNDNNSIVQQSQLTLKILTLLEETKYELIQINGQRHLTAPEYSPEVHGRCRGSEVFLGRLPRDCFEWELMPILNRVGRLLELRLLLDFSGMTRGYGFALFENSTVARRACEILDGYEIRPGHKIGVVKSIDNCRLFFGGVPKDKTKDDFMQDLGCILEGITDIYLYPNAQNRNENRGFIFVEFKDHRAAAMARRKLIPGRIVLWNHEIVVDWAKPERGESVDDELMQSVTALFVRNICPDMSHQSIREIFHKTTGIQILKLKKINHFAFIHYENRETAQRVMDIMTVPGGVAEQENWEIRWAKPLSTPKTHERNALIKESFITNNNSKSNRAISRNSSQRKSNKNKKTNPDNFSSISHPTNGYQQILEAFVADNLNAFCRFDCYCLSDGRFTCKVIIADQSNVIFDCYGATCDSKKNAIENTAHELYERLRIASNSYESCISSNPQLTFENPNDLSLNKIEARR